MRHYHQARVGHGDTRALLPLTSSEATEPRRQEGVLGVRGCPGGLAETALASVSGLAKTLDDLNRQAVREYTPVANTSLRSRSRNTQHIEHALDGLLGFCGYQPALDLYKKLCRYYFDIDPTATVSYINAYREMWETESEDTGL